MELAAKLATIYHLEDSHIRRINGWWGGFDLYG